MADESSEWRQVRGSASREGIGAGGAMEPPAQHWTFEVGRSAPSTEPVVADTPDGRTVYIAGRNGVHAVDESGGERFLFETDQKVGASPTVAETDGLTVYAFSTADTLYAIDAVTGEQRWATDIEGGHSSPAVVDGTVYVGSDDYSLYALDAESGDIEWATETDGMIRTPPAVTDDVVYVGSKDDHLYAFDTDSGDRVWASDLDGGAVESPLAATGSLVFLSEGRFSRNRSGAAVHAFDAETGEMTWTAETEGNSLGAPAVADGTVYVGCSDGNLYGIDTDSGEMRWTFEGDEPEGIRPPDMTDPALCGDTVLIGDDDGRLYGVDADSGEGRWTVDLDEDELSTGPAVHDGMYYVGSGAKRSGYLVSFATAEADTGGTEFGSNDAIDAPTVERQRDRPDWQVAGGDPGRTGHRDGNAATEAAVPDWELDRRGRTGVRHDIAVDEKRLYTYDTNGDHLRAYSLSDGTELWTAEAVTAYSTAPVVADGTVYAGSQSEGAMFGFDVDTGETEWRWDGGGRGRLSEPAVVGDWLTLTVGERLYVLSTETGDTEWETDLGGEGVGSPLVAYGTIYVTADETLHALDPANGVERFTLELDANATAPAVGDEQVVVGADGTTVGVDAETGNQYWEAPIEGVPRTPAVRDGVAYVATDAGVLGAFETDDGDDRWTFAAGDRLSPPAVDGETVLVASADPGHGGDDENLYALDAETGEQRHFHELEDVSDPGRPVVAGDSVLVAPGRAAVIALELRGSTDVRGVETDSWTARGGGLGATNYAGEGALSADAEPGWEADLGYRVNGSAAVEDGVVYAPTADSQLVAYDATTGEQFWESDCGTIQGTPVIDAGTVYAGLSGGTLTGVDAETGERQWTFEADEGSFSGFRSTPALSPDGETLFAGSDDEHLYAVDAGTGEKRWTFDAGADSVSEEEIDTAPMVAGDAVYVASEYNIFGVDAATGTKLWSYEQSHPEGIAFADGRVFVGAHRTLLALDAETGEEVWSVDMPDTASAPAVTDGTVYACSEDSVFAVDAGDGSEQWRCQIGGQNEIAPAVAEGIVYVGGTDGVLHAIDDGEMLWSVELGDRAMLAGAPVVADGVVYVTDSENGRLVAVSERSQEEPSTPASASDPGETATEVAETGDSDRSATDTPEQSGEGDEDGSETGVEETEGAVTTDTSDGTTRGEAVPVSGWSTGRRNHARTGAVESGPTSDPSHRWECDVDGRPSGIAVADGRAYLSHSDSAVVTLDVATGERQWVFEADKSVSAACAVVDGHVYVPSQDEHVYAVDAETGEQVWAFEAGGSFARFTQTPAVSADVVYAPCNDSTLYAVDAETGEQLWAHEGSRDFTASPVVASGLVYARCDDDTLYALATEDGTERWAHDLGTGYGGGASAPALAGETVYVGNDGGSSFYALDAATGDEHWETDLDGSPVDTPAVAGETVYVCCDDDTLRALDSDTGDVLWKTATDGTPKNSPAVADGVVYTATGDRVEAFDAADGSHYFAVQQDGSLAPSPVVADGVVIVGGRTFDAYGAATDDSATAETTEADTDGGIFAEYEDDSETTSTGTVDEEFERHYVTTAADDTGNPGDEQLREAILGILCDKWQGMDRDAHLGLDYITEAVTEVLAGASAGVVRHNVQRLDEQGAVEFNTAYDTVSLRPPGVQRYDELSDETVLPERQLVEVLELLYERARHNPDAPNLTRDEVLAETYLESDELDRTVWFLKAVGLHIGDVYVDEPEVGGYVEVHTVGDAPWWRTVRINGFGKQLYESLSG